MGWLAPVKGILWDAGGFIKQVKLLTKNKDFPRFFLSGDAHGHPPFKWVLKSKEATEYFTDLMQNKKLVLHVEQAQDVVDKSSVPALFQPLLNDGRVLGWELAEFIALAPTTNKADELRSQMNPDLKKFAEELVVQLPQIKYYHKKIIDRFGVAPIPDFEALQEFLMNRVAKAMQYGVKTAGYSEDDYNRARRFLSDYVIWVLGLRNQVNPAIGQSILGNLSKYDDNVTHLIAIGDSHIQDNPVMQFIPIGAEMGVVDPQNK